jgi:hypothetical protein
LLGFFTLVSLALAFVLSGWWWAGFVVMLILWGKQLEAKNPTSIKGKTKELERLVEEYEQADEELSRQLYEDSRQGSSYRPELLHWRPDPQEEAGRGHGELSLAGRW